MAHGRSRLSRSLHVGAMLLAFLDPCKDLGGGGRDAPPPPPPTLEELGADLNEPASDTLTGFVDLHAHPMSHLGFGGRLMHGAPDKGALIPAGMMLEGSGCNKTDKPAGSAKEALGTCFANHGGYNAATNSCGHPLRLELIKQVEKDHHSAHGPDTFGWPTFSDWPRHDDITHQLMWVDWVERAYDGGLRVMVALAVNNRTLALALRGNPDQGDAYTADQQISEMKAMADRHDWMEVATSSEDLRRIVSQDRLAIVLGVEIDEIGDFTDAYRGDSTRPTDTEIRDEIVRLHGLGVRYAFPVHLVDNVFGGTATYEDQMNVANRFQWGRWWELECAPDDITWRHSRPHGFYDLPIEGWGDGLLADVVHLLQLGALPTDRVPLPACAPGDGHRNSRGLQRRGRVAIRQMMRLGMVIDIDHASRHTVDAVFEEAEQHDYPLVSGHNDMHHGGVSQENMRTAQDYRRIGDLGGIVGVGYSELDAAGYRDRLSAVMKAMGKRSVALGTDLNGLVAGPAGPCEGPGGCPGATPVNYDDDFPMSRMESQIGERTEVATWDYNTQGVAHYGLLPDFLKHVEAEEGEHEVEALFDGAENFAVMWRKAEARASSVSLPVSKHRTGQHCDDDHDCATNRCDRGQTTTHTNRCIPNDNEGKVDDYCTHEHHCRPELTCIFEADRPYGACGTGPGIGEPCPGSTLCADGRNCDSSMFCAPKKGEGTLNQYCSNNDQCGTGLACVLDAGKPHGSCKTQPGIGGDCSGGTLCADGRNCDSSNRCAPKMGEGGLNKYCSNNNQCQSHLTCILDAGKPYGSCQGKPGIGGDCSNGTLCADGRNCDGSKRCAPKMGEGAEDQYCSNNNQCESGLTCDLEVGKPYGSCQGMPGIGGDCSGGTQCADGRNCDGSNRCVPKMAEGTLNQYCSNNNQCKPSLTCDLEPGRSYGSCSERPGIGGDCSGGTLCADGRACDSTNRCIPNRNEGKPGQYCSNDVQCLAGHRCLLVNGNNGYCE